MRLLKELGEVKVVDLIVLVLKVCVCVIVFMIVLFLFMCFVFLVVNTLRGQVFKKRTVKSRYKRKSIIKRLFFDFPRRFVLDKYAKNPDAMQDSGLIIFVGSQGQGKTIAAIDYARRITQEYPLVKFRSNIDVSFQDGKIDKLEDIVHIHNGEIGQIDFLDEIQTSFSAADSKNFPVQMLSECTQLRKQTKLLIGTCQAFQRMAKPLREQTKYIGYPITFFGCLTWVRIYKVQVDKEGYITNKKRYKMYFFVHDDELRNCYDTYEKVQSMFIKGFLPRSEQVV